MIKGKNILGLNISRKKKVISSINKKQINYGNNINNLRKNGSIKSKHSKNNKKKSKNMNRINGLTNKNSNK